MSERIVAEAQASGGRRIFGLASLIGLGGLLTWLALSQNMDVQWRALLLALALGGFLLGAAFWRATELRLTLTETALLDSRGRIVASVAEVQKVDRSAFAMKPSNGFVLTLAHRGTRVWCPGIWWRLGRRVAVGGVLPGHETRAMADALAILVADRAAVSQDNP